MTDDLANTFLEQGILGAIVVALILAVVALYRQNQALQKEARETLREVFPAVAALDRALEFVQRGSAK